MNDEDRRHEVLHALGQAIGELTKAHAAYFGQLGEMDAWWKSCATEAESADAEEGAVSLNTKLCQAFSRIGVSLQRYWNGTLVGNHCHKVVRHAKQLKKEVMDYVDACEEGHYKKENVEHLRGMFDLWEQYGVVLDVLSSQEEHSKPQAEAFAAKARAYVENYRTFFDLHSDACHGVIPKMHCLEFHAAEFLLKHGCICIFGDDGIEALHAIENKNKRNNVYIPNAVRRGQANEVRRNLYYLSAARK